MYLRASAQTRRLFRQSPITPRARALRHHQARHRSPSPPSRRSPATPRARRASDARATRRSRSHALFVLTLLVHVSLVPALPREVEGFAPALVQWDEKVRAKVSVSDVELGALHVLARGYHFALVGRAHACGGRARRRVRRGANRRERDAVGLRRARPDARERRAVTVKTRRRETVLVRVRAVRFGR